MSEVKNGHQRYQKKTLLKVVGVKENGDVEVQNEGNPEDQWIIPKETFELTYDPVLPELDDKFGIGRAIEVLNMGRKVQREGWNGKGMWLSLITNYNVSCIPEEESDDVLLPWIGMKTADDKFVPWLASQTDILAEDFMVVE